MAYTEIATINKGTIKGKNIDTIVRRVYGSGAGLRYSADPNDPYVAKVLDRDGWIVDSVLGIVNPRHQGACSCQG